MHMCAVLIWSRMWQILQSVWIIFLTVEYPFQLNRHRLRRAVAEVREDLGGPLLWGLTPHSPTQPDSRPWTPDLSITAILKAQSRRLRLVRVDASQLICSVDLWFTVSNPYLIHVCIQIENTGVDTLSNFPSLYQLFSGMQSGRPDLVPRTPPLTGNPSDCEANLSTSSLGSTGVASSSPPVR